MSKCTEIRVSTQFDAFARVKGLPQPLVVIGFGADCAYKDLMMDELRYVFAFRVEFDTSSDESRLEIALGRQRENVLIVMDSASSWEAECRHRWARIVRRFGAKSVVGVLTKPRKALSNTTDEATRQFFEQNLPDAGDFDALIMLEE